MVLQQEVPYRVGAGSYNLRGFADCNVSAFCHGRLLLLRYCLHADKSQNEEMDEQAFHVKKRGD